MPGMSKFVESLPEHYGCVILTGVSSIFVNMWMAMNVSRARKTYEVKYPVMYHPEPSHVFNCIQRAHQNTLEGYPQFLMLLFLGGLQYPRISAGAGALYILSRIFFAKGYYTGEPKKRSRGAFGMAGILCLLGNTLSLAFHQLQLWPCNQ